MAQFGAGAAAGELLAAISRIAEQAGQEILRHYHPGVEARLKQDRTPVTAADEAAEAIILPALRDLAQDIPSVAEEAVRPWRPAGDRSPEPVLPDRPARRHPRVSGGQWRIHRQYRPHRQGPPDPGRGPSAGPGTTYAGGPEGATLAVAGEAPQSIAARAKPSDGVIVLASRSHNEGNALDLYLAEMHVAERIAAGSSLKFCRIAEGLADLYPRFGRTMEWDTAAGHAVLAAAGGHVVTVDGKPLAYGKAGFDNPDFIARGNWS